MAHRNSTEIQSDTNFQVSLARLLFDYRIDNKLTQRQLSRILRVSVRVLRNLEEPYTD